MKPSSEWKIPEYMDGLPDTALLKAEDISKIFGCNKKLTKYNSIPPPDFKKRNSSFFNHSFPRPVTSGRRTNYWTLGTVRKWIRDNQ